MPTYLLKSVSSQIIDIIVKKKGGYLFYFSLSKSQQTKLINEIMRLLYSEIFTKDFINLLLKVSIHDKNIRTFLRKNFYRGSQDLFNKAYDEMLNEMLIEEDTG